VADVLVVEDDNDLAFLMTTLLRADGHHVVCHGTVRDAVSALEDEPFDVVVTDLGLPDESGFRVCELGRSQGLPVVVVTANAQPAVMHAAATCASAVLSKPFDSEALTAVVRQHNPGRATACSPLSYSMVTTSPSADLLRTWPPAQPSLHVSRRRRKARAVTDL
jgi:DNA-binding response OmpR family regulator